MPKIYISHRPQASDQAERIRQGLSARFGDGHVQLSGHPAAIATCDTLLLVVDPGWLSDETASPPSGWARLDGAVTNEIAAALGAGLRVVPVLVGGATMPDERDLPDGVRLVARRLTLIVTDADASQDIALMADYLKQLAIGPAPEVGGAVSPSPDEASLGRVPIRAHSAHDVQRLTTIGPDTNFISAVCFISDEAIASGGADGIVRVHRVSDGSVVQAISAHAERVTALAVSGNHVASGSTDGTVRIWRLSDEGLEAELRTSSPRVFRMHRRFHGENVDVVLSVAFSRDGGTVGLCDGGGSVRLFTFTERRIRRIGGHDDRAVAIHFSPDGSIAACGSWDGKVSLWAVPTRRRLATITTPERDIKRLKPELYFHLRPAWWVNSVCFSADGAMLATAGGRGRIHLWDSRTHELLAHWEAHNPEAIMHDPHLREIIGLKAPAVWLGRVSSVAFGPQDEVLASAGEDSVVRLWRTSDQACLAEIARASPGVTSLAFSPSGRLLAAGAWDGKVDLLGVPNLTPAPVDR